MINPYKKEIGKFIEGVPDNLEIVNLGSTFSKFGFDYKWFNKKGFNFAVQPQPLAYDYSILKQYSGNIKKGGVIVIVVVCPFGFSVDYYPDDSANYKYYYFLDKNEIHEYSRKKEFFIKYLPFVSSFAFFGFLKRIVKKLFQVCGIRYKGQIRHKDHRINGWMNEFDLRDTTSGAQGEKLSHIFDNAVDSLRKILKICIEYEFKPLIINMPAVKAQSSQFSEEFIESFYSANIESANFCSAPVIDYFRDERFNDSSFYENGIDCLNDKGRKIFAEILIEDIKKLGLCEGIEFNGQSVLSLQRENYGAVCFGTNITLPTFSGNGLLGFAKASARYARKLIKGDKAGGWGKTATLKATKSLIPCVREAVKNGIMIFDCSRAYAGSEKRLARALKDTKREDVFLITKIDDSSQFKDRVEECFSESLRQLGTDYVDLLLLHWPVDYPKNEDSSNGGSVPVYVRSWKTLEKIYKSGKVKAIGVANFSINQLEILKSYAEIMPIANEFECHPLCIRKDLNDYCAKNGIKVFAYAALCAMDKRLNNESMSAIAAKHGKTIAQIILRWHIQSGRVPIFGTTKRERICEYSHLDFMLSDEELEIINEQNINYRAFPDSEHCDFTKGIWLGWENYKDCCP